MKYAQFVCQYRKLYNGQFGYEKLHEECSRWNVGPDSDFPLIGASGRKAPTGMRLNNGLLMKMREKNISVPLLPNGEMDTLTDILLFGHWQHSEEVTQEAVERDTLLKNLQRRTAKLELFPMMM